MIFLDKETKSELKFLTNWQRIQIFFFFLSFFWAGGGGGGGYGGWLVKFFDNLAKNPNLKKKKNWAGRGGGGRLKGDIFNKESTSDFLLKIGRGMGR